MATIEFDDAVILAHDANPDGSNFRKGQQGKYGSKTQTHNKLNSERPEASDWLKAAVRSALECDPVDIMRDAQTLVTLMVGYTPRFGYPARRQWPRKRAAP